MAAVILATLALSTTVNTSTVRAQNNATATPNPATTTSAFLPTNVFQDDKTIVTTVTKNGQPSTGPVVVIPPGPEGGKNGTIINTNTTANQNTTVVIQPNGNITQVPNANVTVVDNNTVVIAPVTDNVTTTPTNVTVITPNNETVTTTPGNVTVVDPVVPTPPQPTNTTSNQTCSCQNNQTSGGNVTIPPVVVTPAPGQEVTTNNASNTGAGGTVAPQNNTNTIPTNNQTNPNNQTSPSTNPMFPSANRTG